MPTLPPEVAYFKYLAGFDANGNLRALEIPVRRGVLFFDPTGTVAANDGMEDGLLIDSLLRIDADNSAMTALIGVTGAGALVQFAAPPADPNQRVPVMQAGVLKWISITLTQVPATGTGIMVRQPGSPINPPEFIGDGTPSNNGIILIEQATGNVLFIPPGTNGKVLSSRADGSIGFDAPSAGAVSSGGASVGLSGVVGSNTSASVVNSQCPAIILVDSGGDQINITGMNISADLTAANGIGGLDVGAEAANTWYYQYAVCKDDGSGIGAMMSLSGTAPSFSNAAGWTHYALVSVLRNDASSNITPFLQRGRQFSTPQIVAGDSLSSTTSLAAISGLSTALTAIVPPNAKTIRGIAGGSTTGETTARYLWLASTVAGIGLTPVSNQITSAAINGFKYDVGLFDIALADPVSPALYWMSLTASTHRKIAITGYSV